MENKNPIQVADRLFQTMEILADTGPVSLAELQTHLPLNKSTLHRLLASLIYMGYANQDKDGKYFLSFKLLTLSGKLLSHMDILDAIRPCLKELAEHTGETVHFVRLDGDMAIYIAKESSCRNSVRMVSRVGSRIPLYCSGVGKSLLSSMTPEEICHYWQHAEIRKFTENTITSPDVMEQALQQIKQTQYALDDEEHEPGVRCIAVSIPWYDKTARYALSISAPVNRMPYQRIDELATLLRHAKEEFINFYKLPSDV